jgi:multisubunit Na+/H+ antiporter MnhG subunit
METFFPGPGRGWFTRLFGRNPLVRASDRIEALALVLGIVLVVLTAPIAGAVGTAVYTSRSAVYEQQVRSRHTVVATVLADSTSTVRPYSVSFDLRARWQDRGVQHETVLGWDRPAKAGDRLSIWVNDKGDYAGPPTRAKRAASDAIVVGALLWLSVITVVAAAIGLTRFRLDRRRHAEWDRGLRGLVGDDGGRTSSEH